MTARCRRRIRVRGLVQGVGFRPFVYTAAAAHQFQAGQRGVRAGLVRLLHDEAHVDDHPVAWLERLLGQ
ncbi:hypothetical protein C6A85_08935, partial [Mycobacterium sp. ITM-2017-0098]